MGDVEIFHTLDGGEIAVENGTFATGPCLGSMAYLCLFGGNEDDDGSADNRLQWWGNFAEPDRARHYRSETQNLMTAMPLTTGNLKRLAEAAKRDTAVMISSGVVSEVNVAIGIPEVNVVRFVISFGENSESVTFNQTWAASL